MARIFISYRRDDSEGFAGRIRDRLTQQFGEDAVFTDINSIPPGAEVRQFIADAVKQCRVMLVLIDRQWLTISDATTGERRLDNPDDFVRLEIVAGLQHGLTVIPVLLRGSPMPAAADLPDPIKGLPSRNAVFIHSNSFNSDVKHMIEAIRPLLQESSPANRRLWIGAALALALIVGIGGAIVALSGGATASPPATMTSPPPPQTVAPVSDTPAPTATTAPPGFAPVKRNLDWSPIYETFDGVEMALVPAGCFNMGSDDGEPDEQPVHPQCFDAPFWIDRTEVTNVQFGAYGSMAGDDYPRDSVNWPQASDHCARRGARLPGEAEWEYAARGPDGIQYPWGNAFVDAFAVWKAAEIPPAGSLSRGASWVGALDMSGSLWEWVSSWYAPYPFDPADGRESPENSGDYQYRVLRGGSWVSKDSYYLRAAYRYGYDQFAADNSVGFRCARTY